MDLCCVAGNRFSDGYNPIGSLIADGSKLYGMSYYGGPSDYGVIFSIQTDGAGFTLLHGFAGGPDDGAYTYGSLIADGSTLYGVTKTGGPEGGGRSSPSRTTAPASPSCTAFLCSRTALSPDTGNRSPTAPGSTG